MTVLLSTAASRARPSAAPRGHSVAATLRRLLATAARHASVLASTLAAALAFAAPAQAQETTCARVKIEIKQQLTLERQAFDAEMRINTMPLNPMSLPTPSTS